jgi:hypothetical protein
MRLSDVPEIAINLLFGRLLRRALGVALLALFALIAVYHVTIAGTLALDAEVGALYARLIVAAIYAVAALVALVVLWATRVRPLIDDQSVAALTSPRNMQMAMLIEAVMLGYSLARKSGDRIR